MIRVFASITDEKPAERHEWSGTLMEWLAENVGDIDPSQPQPIGVTLNGKMLPPQEWEDEVIHSDDVVDITVQPRGVELLIGAISLRETFRPLINALIPDIPSTPEAGRAIDLANAKANRARLGGVVPEILGSHKRYPDYLLPPHRKFVSTRTQNLRLFMCIGQGEYNIPISGVKVGDSQLTSLDGASYTIYEPGADVSADPAAEWWHETREVGGTSTGNSGLPLRGTSNVSNYPNSTTFTFSGDTISIPAGAGDFPSGWDSTLTVRVEQYLDYEIVSGSPRDIIRGPLDQLGPFVGMVIEIAGPNAGTYVINSYTASVPDAPGSASTLTGSAAPSRYDYDVTPVTFTVSLSGADQSITFNTDLTDLSGLLTELNGQLDASITAQDDGTGKVQLVEAGPPYSGNPITVSGTTTDVFGASPVGVTGDETTTAAPAEITLNYESGDPVSGLTPDAARMAIGYLDMLYLVDGATTSTIELTRLDDQGDPDVSWPGFDTITTTDADIYVVGSTASVGWAGPFVACPEGKTTDTIEVDVFFPIGLAYVSGDGGIGYSTQQTQIQYRETGTADPWTTVTIDYANNTLDQIGYTHTIGIPSAIRPEVRMRRSGEPSTQKGRRDVEWQGLKAKIDAPTSYPWTTMSVDLDNSSRISTQSENQINVIAERKIPVLSGGSWTGTNEETRDIIPALRYIAEGVGMPQDQAELIALDSLYKSRGDTFDYVFNETTVRDAMKKVLQAGSAELTVEDGTIKPVRDGERTEFEQGFSPQNMIGGLSRSFSSHRPDDPDGVDVEFTNRDTWASETVECRLPGDLGNKVEKIKLEGVTDRTQAWRIGMRRRRAIKYRRWEYRFDTELEGLNAGYMSYVPLLADQEGYGQSSHMVSISDAGGGNALVVVTEDMDWTGTGHVVAFRNEDGEVVGPFSATIGANDRQIVAAIPPVDWPDLSKRQEPPHVYFGTSEKWHFPALVQAVEPSGPLQVGIRAVNYDERVYADDDNSPPS